MQNFRMCILLVPRTSVASNVKVIDIVKIKWKGIRISSLSVDQITQGQLNCDVQLQSFNRSAVGSLVKSQVPSKSLRTAKEMVTIFSDVIFLLKLSKSTYFQIERCPQNI